MNTLVIDTNVFVSALIKDGVTRDLIVNAKIILLFPEFEFYEIKQHKEEILKKSKLSEKQFDILMLRMLNHVRIIPTNIIINYKKESEDIIQKIDPNDVPFIATALAFNCPIWSDDKHFKRQNKIKIYTTPDMIQLK